MSQSFQKTWETYVSSWKADSLEEKTALFEASLDTNCHYRDPLSTAKGWDELAGYMNAFHQQIPGGHFVTTWFLAHNQRSIAKWEMRNAQEVVLGEGISYGEYNDQGKLLTMTGFFETPEA